MLHFGKNVFTYNKPNNRKAAGGLVNLRRRLLDGKCVVTWQVATRGLHGPKFHSPARPGRGPVVASWWWSVVTEKSKNA